ncbi:hypothetical protein [Scytonema sp. NUACC21]
MVVLVWHWSAKNRHKTCGRSPFRRLPAEPSPAVGAFNQPSLLPIRFNPTNKKQ